MKFYLITDTHFGHDILREYSDRPEHFSEQILSNLRKVPNQQEAILIHLGDICIGKDAYWHEEFSKAWQGKKWLVLGNHDHKSNNWYLEHGWDFVADQFTMRFQKQKILFSHYPVVWDGYYDHNLHGHFHNSDHRRHEPEFVAIKNGYQRLLALEWMDYKPVELATFLEAPNEICLLIHSLTLAGKDAIL